MGLQVVGRMQFQGKFNGFFPQIPPPTPSFTADQTVGPIPLTVNFTNTTTTASGVTYQWDFNGDGVIDSTAVNPTYTYTTTGSFTVSLTALSTGGSSTSTIVNYINPYETPPTTIEGAAIETIPVTLLVSDVNTFLGNNINDLPVTIESNNSIMTIAGLLINDIPITANVSNEISTLNGTQENEIPVYITLS